MRKILIGIDPGVKTGLGISDASTGHLLQVETVGILDAQEIILEIVNKHQEKTELIEIVIENPNLRKWYGKTGRERLQGAGSIKRDFSIWLEFFKKYDLPWREQAPKNSTTKIKPEAFKKITGYRGRTSEHSRDAAMLVFGMIKTKAEKK